MAFTNKEKLILFKQIRDIKLALKLKGIECPLRFGDQSELDEIIDKLSKREKS